jgi:hypothetical protein
MLGFAVAQPNIRALVVRGDRALYFFVVSIERKIEGRSPSSCLASEALISMTDIVAELGM